MQDEQIQPDEEGAWLDLSFVPQWARRPPGANPYAQADRAPEPDRRDRTRPGARDDRRDRRPGEGRGGPDRRQERRRDAPIQRRTGAPGMEGRPAPRPQFTEPRPVWLPLEICFLPERSALRGVVRRVQASHRAYPLLDLAMFFLSNDAFYEVKVDVRREEADGFRLFRCRTCGFVAVAWETVAGHASTAHAEDLLVQEDVDDGPPAGQFVCVTRCRRGGHLIGPPNHHRYTERLAEIRLNHFSGVSDGDFMAQLETVRDPDLIEQWKEAVRIRRVFRRKDDPGAEPMDATAAQAWLEETVAHDRVQEVRRAILPAAVARTVPDEGLRRALGEAWAREHRFPRTMLLALRPALRHLGLHLFRAGDHAWFVTAVTPSAVEPDHAVESVRRILEHVEAHPGVSTGDMMEALLPGAAPDAPARHEIERHLQWLVAKGHVIEFSSGALSAPRRRGAKAARTEHA